MNLILSSAEQLLQTKDTDRLLYFNGPDLILVVINGKIPTLWRWKSAPRLCGDFFSPVVLNWSHDGFLFLLFVFTFFKYVCETNLMCLQIQNSLLHTMAYLFFLDIIVKVQSMCLCSYLTSSAAAW